jgi:hypothetical protein
MSAEVVHDRGYMQSRLREEMARHARHGHPFAIVLFEARPGDRLQIRRRIDWWAETICARLRPSDVIARAFDDTIVALLVETDAMGAHDVVFRLRNVLASSGAGAGWTLESYIFPQDEQVIRALPLLTAA